MNKWQVDKQVENEIELSKLRGHTWIDNYAYSLKTYVRIIYDNPIKFPQYYDMLNYKKDMEVHHLKWNKYWNKGWGKPDIDLGGVEIYYLWKQFKTNF